MDVSPIRPENRARYPAAWPAISARIRHERAGGQCECGGECGKPHAARCEARNGQRSPYTGSLVILTVAHLDHTPENCEEANLKAMCQRCHLSYDADHHAQTAARTRAVADAAQMDALFEMNGGSLCPGSASMTSSRFTAR
jgi:hypothetical protein